MEAKETSSVLNQVSKDKHHQWSATDNKDNMNLAETARRGDSADTMVSPKFNHGYQMGCLC